MSVALNDGSIDVALSSDQNYLPGLLIASCSLAMHARRETVIVYHILDNGIDDDSFTVYERVLERLHPKAIVRRYRMTADTFANCDLYNNSFAPYSRLLLPRLLANVDRVLYYDCDILWMTRIEDLWDMPFDGHWMMACHDDAFPESIKDEIDYLGEAGFHVAAERYFNSGVLYMDLDAMRANRVVEQFVAFLANHKTPRFPDQSLLNAVMAGHVKLVDRMWNSLFPQTCPRDFQSGLVLHYINATPWLDRSARVTHDNRIYLWHDFRDLVLARPSGSSIRDFFSGRVVTKKRLCARLLSNRLTAYLALRLFNAAANGSLPLNMIDNVRSLSDARRREIVGKWRDDLYARGYAE